MNVVHKSIVVTGASSGIGEATALHLDELGFSVFAGVRRDADGEVKDLPGIPPIEVAKAVANALTTAKPRPHSLIGPGARKMKNLSRLPAGLRDWLLAKALYARRSA